MPDRTDSLKNCLTTGQLVEALTRQDPSGEKIVWFRVYDECYEMELNAAGEAVRWRTSLKGAKRMMSEDVDVLQVDVWIDCDVG